jgi:hypothetical protein
VCARARALVLHVLTLSLSSQVGITTQRLAVNCVPPARLATVASALPNIRLGKKGYAYVIDRDARLIAHPDISLVLRTMGSPGYSPALAASRTESMASAASSLESIRRGRRRRWWPSA